MEEWQEQRNSRKFDRTSEKKDRKPREEWTIEEF
jgi:hypothetical protein